MKGPEGRRVGRTPNPRPESSGPETGTRRETVLGGVEVETDN